METFLKLLKYWITGVICLGLAVLASLLCVKWPLLFFIIIGSFLAVGIGWAMWELE